jgi:hypothetical protein
VADNSMARTHDLSDAWQEHYQLAIATFQTLYDVVLGFTVKQIKNSVVV